MQMQVIRICCSRAAEPGVLTGIQRLAATGIRRLRSQDGTVGLCVSV
jgi:hypothetical protein